MLDLKLLAVAATTRLLFIALFKSIQGWICCCQTAFLYSARLFRRPYSTVQLASVGKGLTALRDIPKPGAVGVNSVDPVDTFDQDVVPIGVPLEGNFVNSELMRSKTGSQPFRRRLSYEVPGLHGEAAGTRLVEPNAPRRACWRRLHPSSWPDLQAPFPPSGKSTQLFQQPELLDLGWKPEFGRRLLLKSRRKWKFKPSILEMGKIGVLETFFLPVL